MHSDQSAFLPQADSKLASVNTQFIIFDAEQRPHLQQDGLIDLNSLGTILVTGADAAKFLHGQLTCDVLHLNERQSQLGACCTHQGRIVATLRIYRQDDNFYLLLPKDNLAALINQLKKYILMAKVTLADISDQYRGIGYVGAAINTLFKSTQPIAAAYRDVTFIDSLTVMNLTNSTPRYTIFGRQDELQVWLNQYLPTLPWLTDSLWQLFNIADGIPDLSIATRELFTPHMINFQALNGVSFNKGCYTGQEIIARTHYLGKLKQSMYRIKLTSDQVPLPGRLLYTADSTEQPIGTLVSVSPIATHQYHALAVIQHKAIASAIYLAKVDSLAIEILPLPYSLETQA